MATVLSRQQREKFAHDGFVIVRQFFDSEEVQLLKQAMEQDPVIRSHMYDRLDSEGAVTKMAAWNHPGDSVYGLAARSEKMVDTMEDLLEGEVYHYHSKLTAKEPYDGGAWEWHQDYGYWYHNGCLYPLMASAMTALDETNRENGCLQVLRGSHRLGRIEHGLLEGMQVGADVNRVEQVKKHHELVYVEMQPGDVLLFHCNLLHRSDQNRSANRRWTLICCYNAARNNPYLEHHHPQYTPIVKVPDSSIKQNSMGFASPTDEKHFLGKPVPPAELKT